MFTFLSLFLALVLAAPAYCLLALTISSLAVRRNIMHADSESASASEALDQEGDRLSVAVIVPAHNESRHALPTLECILSALGARDRLIVIADNCTDDTASVARQTGAEVIERNEPDRHGKSYALAYGVDYLRPNPPDVVLIIDSDCLLSDGGIQAAVAECGRFGRPVQMRYLIHSEEGAGLKSRIVAFAMIMKNWVRPLGTFRLGGVCHLMGSGMALPWRLVESTEFASGSLVEDLVLGIDLAKQGHCPRYLSTAHVNSKFSKNDQTVHVQKKRWEHGHLATLFSQLPALLACAIRQRNPGLFVLAMDLMIPPVALYFLILLALLVVSCGVALSGADSHAMLYVAVTAVASFGISIIVGWLYFARHLLSIREIFMTPIYVAWKIPIYIAFFLKKRSGWIRTKRRDE